MGLITSRFRTDSRDKQRQNGRTESADYVLGVPGFLSPFVRSGSGYWTSSSRINSEESLLIMLATTQYFRFSQNTRML